MPFERCTSAEWGDGDAMFVCQLDDSGDVFGRLGIYDDLWLGGG